jgi:hypothetical protein
MVNTPRATQDDVSEGADGSSTRAGDEQERRMQIHHLGRVLGITAQWARRKARLRVAFTVSGVLIAGCAVLLGQPGNAQSERVDDAASSSQARCSNRTVRGSYAFSIEGTILAGPNRLLLRGLAMTQFDGRGNLSQVDFTTINGASRGTDWRSGWGSYEINSDCTGTMEILQSDGSPTLRLRLVVADRGRTIYNIVEGNSTGATGTKVD